MQAAHAWLAVSNGTLLRADRIVEIIDGPTVSVRFADNPTDPYPIPESAPASGRELAAVLDKAETLARHYGKAQQVSAADGPPAHWVIAKMDVPQAHLAVWPPGAGNSSPPASKGDRSTANEGLTPDGPLPSDDPLPYYTLGMHEGTGRESADT